MENDYIFGSDLLKAIKEQIEILMYGSKIEDIEHEEINSEIIKPKQLEQKTETNEQRCN